MPGGEANRSRRRRWTGMAGAASGLMLLASSLHGVSVAAAQSVSVPVIQVDDSGVDVIDDRLLNPMGGVRQEDRATDRGFEIGDDRLTGEMELGDLRQEDSQSDRTMEVGDDRLTGNSEPGDDHRAVAQGEVGDDHGSTESHRHGNGNGNGNGNASGHR